MKKLLLLCVLLLASHAAPSFAQSLCTSIETVPATISVPGNYCLIGNHSVNITSGAAITITASDVHLDCVNFSVTNTATSASGSSSGIDFSNRHGVTVKNCRILGGFTNGITATQALSSPPQVYYSNIIDNYIAGPYRYGIQAYGSGIEIRGNRIYDVGGQSGSFAMGIRIAGPTGVGMPRFFLLKDNLVAGTNAGSNVAYGIYSDNSIAAIIINNGVSGTTGGSASYGIRTGGTTNRITDNHVVGSGKAGDVGIWSQSSTDSCFDNYIRATLGTSGCNASMGNY
jgi:hypothetical protein